MRELRKNKETIVVAMSGGVDSSVSAALLLEQGYHVIGVTMKTYEFDEVGGNVENETSCCGLGAIHDARLVAAKLGIPHYVVDFRSVFNKEVIGNFVDEYLQGRTPNPCVICNREIKWGQLLKKAEALGAERIATGHYARLSYDPGRKRFGIARAKFLEKDQSYALWAIGQEALSKTMFPLGEVTKPQVRELAARFGLRTANKQESYEICFVPDNRYDRFLKEQVAGLEMQVAGGEIIRNGEAVGTHRGYPFYTIGQRRGIGAYGAKMYVTGIEKATNRIVVGPENDLFRSGLIAESVNWVGIPPSREPLRVAAKVRYKDDATPATVTPLGDDSIRVQFVAPKRAITPGQSVVFYDGDLLLGGGIIRAVLD